MSPQLLLALALAVVCALTDIRRGLIYNVVTLPAALAGLTLNLALGGLSGLRTGVFGLLAGFGIGFALLGLRVFFGGDLKLLMAFGAIAGSRCLLQTTFLAIVLLGIQGVITLAVKGVLRRTAENLWAWANLRGMKLKASLPASNMTMPMAPAFLAAAIVTAIKGGGI